MRNSASISRIWPTEPKENLRWRLKLREKADKDPAFRRKIISLCSKDILFYVNFALWVFEPRIEQGGPIKMPFCSWQFQDEKFFIPFVDAIERSDDILVEKSRDLGATWMFLAIAHWYWHFLPGASIGIMTRNQDILDKTNAKDTLFWKLDFFYTNLPKWMRPARQRIKNQLTNLDTEATIEGATTTGDSFRGGRKLFVGVDEFPAYPPGDDYELLASTQYAAGTRAFIGTPQGPKGAYYDIATDEHSKFTRINLDWKDHPVRGTQLFTVDKSGVVHDIDPEDPYLDKELFVKDYAIALRGKGFQFYEDQVLSPYYIEECLSAGATPQSVAQELDKSYGGSGYQWFGSELRKKLERETEPPLKRLLLSYDTEEWEVSVQESDDGPHQLWNIHLDPILGPPRDRWYVIGCDIAAGTGGSHSSYSALEVFDHYGNHILEFVSNVIIPQTFARLVYAVGHWFMSPDGRIAYVAWEANGSTGSAFTKEFVRNLRYGNCFHRNVKHEGHVKKTTKPGWWSDEETKGEILGDFQSDLDTSAIRPKSAKMIRELGQYVFLGGKVVHAKEVNTHDESGIGKAHGDAVIGGALANMLRKIIRPSTIATRQRRKSDGNDLSNVSLAEIPHECMAARLIRSEKSSKKSDSDGWD